MVLPAPGSSASRKRIGCRDLVGQGLDDGGMYRQERIKQMRKPDAVCLRNKMEQATITVEAPGPSVLGGLDPGLVVTIEQHVCYPAGRILIGEFKCF